MERFKSSPYHQLEEQKRQFRLLKLCNSDTECIKCELGTFSLTDNDLPSWKALSYRWGDDEPNFVVHLNDEAIPIRKNLHKIITQMVKENRRDWIFIDALCIDQENEAEKPGQVELMGEIYRQAEAVVTWIVYEPDDDEEDGAEGPTYDPYQSPSMWRKQLEGAVLENSYWSRLWIVQEVLLAKALIIRMGATEVNWLNLIPEKTIFTRRGLPDKNENLGLRQTGTDPYANKTTALNILSFRKFETKSLRAGHHLPFYKAFGFFSTQRCGRPHDRVFGYLGLTNSRVQVDYSISILDLFVATLADYMLSAGFITDDLTPIRRRMDLMRGGNGSVVLKGNDIIAPILAFDLDLDDPVVYSLFYEVVKFFAPGMEEGVCAIAIAACLGIQRLKGREEEFHEWLNGDHKFEFRYIGSVCIKVVKLVASEICAFKTYHKEMIARQKGYVQEDPVLTASDGGETKKYSEWIAHAREISEQMWERFQELGEDADGDMEDESWTLIA